MCLLHRLVSYYSKGEFRDPYCWLEVSMLHSRLPSAFFHKPFRNLSHCFWSFHWFQIFLNCQTLCSNSNRSPDYQSSLLRSSFLRCFFDLLSFEDFCRNKLGIIIAAFITIFFRGESSIKQLIIKQLCQLVNE